MFNYFIFIAGFALAAALAAIPASMLLRRLGFSPWWGVVIFLLLISVPFLPAMIVATVPELVLSSSNIAFIGVGLKIVEWAPALVLIWYFALTARSGGTRRSSANAAAARTGAKKKARARK
jgi:hypothetical protein